VTARERLAAVLAPDVLDAFEELVAERVAHALAGTENDNGSPWLSVQEAAEYARVSERTLSRAIARGRVRSETCGRRRLLHRDEVDAYLRAGGEE